MTANTIPEKNYREIYITFMIIYLPIALIAHFLQKKLKRNNIKRFKRSRILWVIISVFIITIAFKYIPTRYF